jgi:hypothetical protein
MRKITRRQTLADKFSEYQLYAGRRSRYFYGACSGTSLGRLFFRMSTVFALRPRRPSDFEQSGSIMDGYLPRRCLVDIVTSINSMIKIKP